MPNILVLKDIEKMGSKVTKEVGGQTSCGCVCYCAGSDSGCDEESVIGSCGEENECVDDAVSASDATGLTIECQRFSMIIMDIFMFCFLKITFFFLFYTHGIDGLYFNTTKHKVA